MKPTAGTRIMEALNLGASLYYHKNRYGAIRAFMMPGANLVRTPTVNTKTVEALLDAGYLETVPHSGSIFICKITQKWRDEQEKKR